MGQFKINFMLLLCGVLLLARTASTYQYLQCYNENECAWQNYNGWNESIAIWDGNNITSIRLTNYIARSLQSDIFLKLPNLRNLDATYCHFLYIESTAFEAASNLIELNLSHNTLIGLNELTFSGASELRYIDLSHNSIRQINHEAFKGLAKLTKIDLSFNDLTDVSGLDNCIGLEALSLRNNRLNSLSFLKNLTNLRILDLSDMQLPSLYPTDAKVFRNLTNLKHLVLKSVGLSEVLDLYGDYIFTNSLEILDISNNNIKTIDIRYLINLDNLREIHLYGNSFIQTPVFEDVINLVFPKLSGLGIYCLMVFDQIIYNPYCRDDVWECIDIAKLLETIKHRSIIVLPTYPYLYYELIEGVPCKGEIYTRKFNYTAYGYQDDEDNRSFDRIERIIFDHQYGGYNYNQQSFFNYASDTIFTPIIITLILTIVLLVASIAITISFIYFGRKLIRT